MRNIVIRSDGTVIRLRRPRRIQFTVALALGLALALAGTLAMTVTSTHAAAATDTQAADYCNYNVSTHSGRCFYSEQELLDYSSTNSPFIYIEVFDANNFDPGRGYKTIGGNGACTPPLENEGKNIADLSRHRWVMPDGSVRSLNNTISSVVVYDGSGCSVKFFDGVNHTGASTSWLSGFHDLVDIGFDNRAASLKFS